ncbi:MAG: helicase, partial [Labilithrix sp.]|nr:helicase [Labilithrix sp.]
MPQLVFRGGTIELRGLLQDAPGAASLPGALAWDPREACYRAPAMAYRDVVQALHDAKLELTDEARRYEVLASGPRVHREPRPFQSEALAAWRAAGGRGVVVLPTGAGKTHVAVMAIDAIRRSTLVIAPTLDLVRQWYDLLRATFDIPVGVVGGGDHDVQP